MHDAMREREKNHVKNMIFIFPPLKFRRNCEALNVYGIDVTSNNNLNDTLNRQPLTTCFQHEIFPLLFFFHFYFSVLFVFCYHNFVLALIFH